MDRPLPWYIALAYRVVANYLDQDLGKWPPTYRTRVLVAALDAEPRGRLAVKIAVHQTAREIMREWRENLNRRRK